MRVGIIGAGNVGKALAGSMGFTPLDVGGLDAARHLEWMAFLNIKLNVSNGWDWSSAWKLAR